VDRETRRDLPQRLTDAAGSSAGDRVGPGSVEPADLSTIAPAGRGRWTAQPWWPAPGGDGKALGGGL